MNPNFKDFHGAGPGDKLLDHARWIAERFERMNEQLLNLSGTFIGFLSVELGLFAQLSNNARADLGNWKFVGIVGMATLGTSIICFFLALTSIYFPIPSLDSFQSAIDLDKEKLNMEPLRLMVSSNFDDKNIQKSLHRENRYINLFYRPGLYLGLVSQILIVLTLIVYWLR